MFDQVAIKKGSGFNIGPASAFLALPLTERVKLISSGAVRFLKGGKIVPVSSAIAAMKQMAA